MVFPVSMPWFDRLRLGRQAKHMTQQQLADAIGASRSQVYRWEVKGQLIPEYCQKKVAAVLEEPVETLFKNMPGVRQMRSKKCASK